LRLFRPIAAAIELEIGHVPRCAVRRAREACPEIGQILAFRAPIVRHWSANLKSYGGQRLSEVIRKCFGDRNDKRTDLLLASVLLMKISWSRVFPCWILQGGGLWQAEIVLTPDASAKLVIKPSLNAANNTAATTAPMRAGRVAVANAAAITPTVGKNFLTA
jgi:hypothetical protein